MGWIENSDIREASGIVESRKNPHVLWVHNDRNNENRLFAISPAGKTIAVYYLDGIVNRDWEDIAIGPGPSEGIDYLYIGDVGDNNAEYDLKYIYRVPEPDVNFMQDQVTETLFGTETITCQYPDGIFDSETIMLDPLTKDLYVVTKREFNDLRLYRAAWPQSTSEVITMDHTATLSRSQLVAGDISPDGLEILIKDYEKVYYWSRTSGQNIWDVLVQEPVVVPYIEETQGEAICWAADASGYYTLSERGGVDAFLYFYPRINQSSVVINEVMASPLTADDNSGEWFEIYNNSTETVDLNGWTIRDAGSDLHVISQPLIMNPGEYLVLGSNSNSVSNGGVMVHYQYDNFQMENVHDEISILSPTGELMDKVSYDDGAVFPMQQGYSFALKDPNLDNNFGLHWSLSDVQIGTGDYGTPGYSNIAVVQSLAVRDVQYTEDPFGVSPLLNQIVSVSGVVTTNPLGFFHQFFYIQDSMDKWSGIAVRKHTTQLEEGDSIKITGLVAERSGNVTEIINGYEYEILKKGVFGISPVEVSTGEVNNDGENAEAYEGMLIKVSGQCDSDDLGGIEWGINDGTGQARILPVYLTDFSPVIGMHYEVSGIQYFSGGNYKIIPWSNADVITAVELDEELFPLEYKLYHNYPNPFNPATTITYSIPQKGMVLLKVYDVLGKETALLVNEQKMPGEYQVELNAENLSSGVYIYGIEVNNFRAAKKMLLIK